MSSLTYDQIQSMEQIPEAKIDFMGCDEAFFENEILPGILKRFGIKKSAGHNLEPVTFGILKPIRKRNAAKATGKATPCGRRLPLEHSALIQTKGGELSDSDLCVVPKADEISWN